MNRSDIEKDITENLENALKEYVRRYVLETKKFFEEDNAKLTKDYVECDIFENVMFELDSELGRIIDQLAVELNLE